MKNFKEPKIGDLVKIGIVDNFDFGNQKGIITKIDTLFIYILNFCKMETGGWLHKRFENGEIEILERGKK